MGLAEILTMLGCSTIIGGTISFFIQRAIKRHDAARDRRLDEERIKQKREQDEIKKKTEALESQNKATMLGVQALLRDRLLQGFRHYIDKGWADYDDRQNMLNMYTQYETLGPNSVMNDLYQKFTNLPEQPEG